MRFVEQERRDRSSIVLFRSLITRQVLSRRSMSIGKSPRFQVRSSLCVFFSVDYNRYPSLDNESVHYYQVELTAGDCIFIPALWIHQVRSTYRNIAVNYWLEHQRTKTAQIDRANCAVVDEANLMTLETIPWPSLKTNVEYLKNYILDLIDDDTTDFKGWTREFSKVKGRLVRRYAIVSFSTIAIRFRSSI